MRMGPRTGSQSVHPSGVGRAGGVYPTNAGMGKIVQDSLSALAAASARKQKEAISGVDSVQLLLWQPLTSGPVCACRGGDPTETPNSNPNVLGGGAINEPSINDGPEPIQVVARNVSPAYQHTSFHQPMVSDQEPVHRFGISDILGDDAPDTKTQHGMVGAEYHGGGTASDAAYNHEWNETEFGNELIADYDKDPWDVENILAENAYILGTSTTSCPICLNTGIVGGYALWGGTRLICESTASPILDSAYLVDANALVPTYTVEAGGSLTWYVGMPSYFTVLWALVRNKRQATEGFSLAYSLDNVTFVSNLAGLSTGPLSELFIRVTNNSTEPQELTHTDITVIHVPLLGQTTNIALPSGKDALFKADPITITFPAEVGIVDRNALVGELKYQLPWRVANVDAIADANMRVTSVSVGTKLVLPSEIEATLMPKYAYRFSKQRLFQGVEPIQGER